MRTKGAIFSKTNFLNFLTDSTERENGTESVMEICSGDRTFYKLA